MPINTIRTSKQHKQIECIIHIADIHIRNWKRHQEYLSVFEKLWEKVEQSPPDTLVVVGGDIAHAKTDMSPELVSLISKFLTGLADKRPTVIICGNHDANLNNNHRLDVLTPIIENLNHPNLSYLRNSGLFKLGNLDIGVMSLLDPVSDYPGADTIPTVPGRYKLALYHGTLANSSVDSGMSISHGLDWDTFAGYDLALLGDIHKRQVLSESQPLMLYPGSLIQQGFGELFEDHGMCIVRLEPSGISYNFYDIPNEYGYLTVDVDGGKLPPELPITSKTSVRLRCRSTSSAQLKRILATIRKKYSNSNVLVQNHDRPIGSPQDLDKQVAHIHDTRDLNHQIQLITEFLHEYDSDLVSEVVALHKETQSAIPREESVRNAIWKPKRFEFSNMFSYGEGNVIDFSSLEGTCGIFAPNHAGKSAILDALCFCLFDQSFRAAKAEQVLNKKKESFWCKLEFELQDCTFFIEKKAHKYKSGALKGNLRVDIDFWKREKDGTTTSLNGEQRRDTNKIIQSYVGTYDDFILTALSLQHNNSNFIDKTQGERKDLLANFLDLRVFDQLYELVGKESRRLNILLDEYQKQSLDAKLSQAESDKEREEAGYQAAVSQMQDVESKLNALRGQIVELSRKITPCEFDFSDRESLESSLDRHIDRLRQATDQKAILAKNLQAVDDQIRELQVSLDESVKGFDTELYREYTNKVREKSLLDQDIRTFRIGIANKLAKLEKLNQHEYDPNCKYCISNVFVKDALDAKDQLESDRVAAQHLAAQSKTLSDTIAGLAFLDELKSKIDRLEREASQLQLRRSEINHNISRFEGSIIESTAQIERTQSRISAYELNLNTIQANEVIQVEIDGVELEIGVYQKELTTLQDLVRTAHSRLGVATQIINSCEESIQHMQALEDRRIVLGTYEKAICRDGIPYMLISRAVPFLESQANAILSQIVDFTIQLVTDGKNVNAFILYEDSRWPLELSSGMERFLSSLAIRIALVTTTNLSKPDFIAIDEGLGVLDSSNLNSMHNLFLNMKDIFKFTLVISHIDVVRDMVDRVITIDRKDDLSYICT